MAIVIVIHNRTIVRLTAVFAIGIVIVMTIAIVTSNKLISVVVFVIKIKLLIGNDLVFLIGIPIITVIATEIITVVMVTIVFDLVLIIGIFVNAIKITIACESAVVFVFVIQIAFKLIIFVIEFDSIGN